MAMFMRDWMWVGDISLSELVLFISVVVILPIQLLLCFKVKPLFVRLLPAILLCVLALASILMSLTATGWDTLGYIFFAIYAAIMILMCGIGWGVWAIVNIIKKKTKRV